MNPLVAGSNPAGRMRLTFRLNRWFRPEVRSERLDRPSENSSIEATSRTRNRVAFAMVGLLCLAHTLAILASMDGLQGLIRPDPLPWHDHPMHLHNAVITKDFLTRSGTTAGYDPSFMAGYAKSIVSDPSGTAPELFVAVFGRSAPVVAYKVFVFLATASIPFWIAWATVVWGGRGRGRGRADAVLVAVLLSLIYLWTDFPLEYAGFGMVSYLLAIPLGVLVAGLIARWIELGGLWRWVSAAFGSTLLVLVHPLAVLIVGPSALLSYAGAALFSGRSGRPFSKGRHLGVWTIPIPVLLGNAFWWYPGVWLSSTGSPPDLAFFHPEPVSERLGQILGLNAPVQGEIQAVLLAGALVGLAALAGRSRILVLGLGGFLAAGFAWGYLAGAFRALDFLQPGRHTYALYTGAAVASGIAWSEIRRRLRAGGKGRLDRWLAIGLILVGVRMFGPSIASSFQYRTARECSVSIRLTPAGVPEFRIFPKVAAVPFLSSRPSRRWQWLLKEVQTLVEPGERLLYEEGGRAVDGLADPFGGQRFGGLLPTFTGVEVIGGPFLHVPVETNFTQFGEGRLFGRSDWDRAHFVRYARLYRPRAIVCWSPRARAFCKANPDLIEVLDEERGGPLLIGLVKGFEGPAIQGKAKVQAEPGRLRVWIAPDEVDGLVVLRYHSMPYLRSRPPVPLESVQLEGDPVPFIGIRPPADPLTLELNFPP